MYFRNTWVLLTFFHSPSIKCWSPCSWGKLCAWTAAWTFPCYPLSNTALEGFQMFTIFWSALLDIQLSFLLLRNLTGAAGRIACRRRRRRGRNKCARGMFGLFSALKDTMRRNKCARNTFDRQNFVLASTLKGTKMIHQKIYQILIHLCRFETRTLF